MTDVEGMRVVYTADISSYESAVSAVVTISESAGEAISSTKSAVETLGSQLDVVSTGFNGLASSGDVAVVSAEAVAERLALLGESAATAGADLADGLTPGVAGLDDLSVAGIEAADSISTSMNDVNFSDLTAAIDSLSQSLTIAIEDMAADLTTLQDDTEQTASSMESSFSHFSLGGMVNQVGLSVMNLQNMGNMATQLASNLLGPSIAAQKMQGTFTNLLGSTTAATNELKQLNDFASKTQFKTADIDTAAATMVGFGFKTKAIIPDLTAVGDALTSVGKDTPAEMQSVVNIFGKMSEAGKLTQGDITQLGAHGVNAMKDIAAGSGLSTTAIQDMIKKGTFPASQAIDDLTKGIEKNPMMSGAMARQAGLMGGLMSTLASDWNNVLVAFGSPIITSLQDSLSNVLKILESDAFQTFAGSVGQGIANVFTKIQVAASHVPFKEIGKDINQLGQWAKTSLIPAITQAEPGFQQLGDSMGKLAMTILPPLIKGGETLLPPIIKLAGQFAGGLAKGIDMVVSDGKGLVDFFAHNQTAMDALLAVVGSVGLVLLALATTQIPVLIASLIAWAAAQLPVMIETLATAAPYILVGAIVAAVVFGIIEAIQHWGDITKWLTGVWSAITGFFSGLLNGVVNFFKKWGLDILEFMMGPIGLIIHFWNPITAFFKNIIGDIGNAFSGLGKLISNVWSGIWGSIKQAIDFIIGGIDSFIAGIDSIHVNVPGIGNVGFNIPKIPMLAAGGVIPPGGMAIAGETGKPELVLGGTSGATVVGVNQTHAMMAANNQAMANSLASGGRQNQQLNLYLDGKQFARLMVDDFGNAFMNQLRGGGQPRNGGV